MIDQQSAIVKMGMNTRFAIGAMNEMISKYHAVNGSSIIIADTEVDSEYAIDFGNNIS
jgi:hypothetical protein